MEVVTVKWAVWDSPTPQETTVGKLWDSTVLAGLTVLFSPALEGLQDRTERLSFFRQVIFQSGGMCAVLAARDHTLSLQGFQSGGQSIGSHAGQRVLEILEATRSL